MRLILDAIVNVSLIAIMRISVSRDSVVPIVTIMLGMIMMIAYNLLSRATRVKVIKITKEDENND